MKTCSGGTEVFGTQFLIVRGREMDERLDYLKKRIKKSNIYYSSYNPQSEYLQDVEDAKEDFLWMLFEIERLRQELDQLNEGL